MTTVYKIRRKSDGLFSNGGSWPNFNKTGKIWKRKSDLTSHFSCGGVGLINHYLDCEIVEYELKETEINSLSINAYLVEIEVRKQAEQKRQQAARERQAERDRRTKYEELRKEFG